MRTAISLPFVGEKPTHNVGGLVGEHSLDHGGLGMEWLSADECGVAAFFVGGTENDSFHLAPSDGSGAHQARFDGDVEGGVGEIFASKPVHCRGQGDHFGMGGDVVEVFGRVVAVGDNPVVDHYYRSDGHFALVESFLRLTESGAHKTNVGIGGII